ncbi:MAG: SPOR domain-containing protein [Gemmatimonadaceae bacterium]
MQRPFLFSLLLLPTLACNRDKQAGIGSGAIAARAEGSRGPDPVLIRLPRNGGTARAYLYPKLDSAIWRGRGTSVDRVLGFDPEGGALAVVDAKGEPARIDLRLGEANVASKAKLASLVAPTGTDIFGIDGKGAVVRLTRAGGWSFTPPVEARGVFPQSDGSVLIAGQQGGQTAVWKLRPPDTVIRDTVLLPITMRGVRAQVGDRVYFATDSALVGVRARDMSVVPRIALKGRVLALAPTPSGDRVYVATAGDSGIAVIDRYTDKVAARVALPGQVSDLRMDRLGRYVLARPVRGDSAWVIAVATDSVAGSVHTKWTDDLPTVAPDGAIVVNNGRDVVFLDGETLQPVRTVAGGAQDYWYFIFWNGFRARAAGMDQPVSFASADSAKQDSSAGADSAALGGAAAESTSVATTAPPPSAMPPAASPVRVPEGGTAGANPPVAPHTAAPLPPRQLPARTPPRAPAVPTLGAAAAPGPKPSVAASTAGPYTVSFAALLTEEKAKALADSIEVEGVKARVAAAQRGGATVYRVVLGPYPNRAEAERIGHESKRSYWAFQGTQ